MAKLNWVEKMKKILKEFKTWNSYLCSSFLYINITLLITGVSHIHTYVRESTSGQLLLQT